MTESLLSATISGTTAATITSLLTYPLDFSKTQKQLNNEQLMNKFKIPHNGAQSLSQVFRGSSASVIGNIVKSQSRLMSYTWATKFMSIENHDHTMKTSAPRMVIAGAITGFIETLIIIPFENVKITMIQNMSYQNELDRVKEKFPKLDITAGAREFSNKNTAITSGKFVNDHLGTSSNRIQSNVFQKQYVSPNAYLTSDLLEYYKGHKNSLSKFSSQIRKPTSKDKLRKNYNTNPSTTMFNTIKEIYTLKGLHGFTAGTWITMARQVMISTVWISTYNATKQLLDPNLKETGLSEPQWFGHKHTALQSIGLHFFAATSVVTVTQPLDVVKTHMQSKNGKSVYKDSLSTAYRLFVSQGPLKLWAGALPRGIKIFASGGLTATIFRYVEGLQDTASTQKIFAAE